MPFDAATLGNLEDALSECFNYHRSLDSFVTRSGIPESHLVAARARAEKRAKERSGGFVRGDRAPKRFVAQELITELTALGNDGDRLISNLITGLIRGTFKESAPDGRDAITSLKARIDADRRSKREEAELRAAEIREKEADETRRKATERAKYESDRAHLREAFVTLSQQPHPQSRGYLFEIFLKNLFEFEKLQPRGSFRLKAEQIDGSFVWHNKTHLLEAKWISEPVAGAEFGAFTFKIEGKTADTRGIYIAINGYSVRAIEALNGKGSLRFVCIDGAHLLRAFEPEWTFSRILEVIWRHADETGEAYLPVSRFPSL